MPKSITREEVLRRKLCTEFQLFDYIHVLLYVENREDLEESIFELFLEAHETESSTKVNHKDCDGGPYTVQKLKNVLRAAVKANPSSAEVKEDPIKAILRYGPKAVTWDHYQETLKSFRESHPGQSPTDRWPHPDQQVAAKSRQEAVSRALVATSPADKNDTTHIHGAHLSGSTKAQKRKAEQMAAPSDRVTKVPWSENKGRQREVLDLHKSDLKEARQPSKRKSPARRQATRDISTKVVKGMSVKPSAITRAIDASHGTTEVVSADFDQSNSSSDPPRIAHTSSAEKSQDLVARTGGQATARDAYTNDTTAVSVAGRTPFPPYTRERVTGSRIQNAMSSIHLSLWSSLRKAFVDLRYQYDEPGYLLKSPSESLKNLYATCLGREWESITCESAAGGCIQSIDLFVALVGASLQSEVLQGPPLEGVKVSISDIHKAQFTKWMIEYEVNLDNFLQNIAVSSVMQPYFEERVIRPTAQKIVALVSSTLLEHLSRQPQMQMRSEHMQLPRPIADAVSDAFQAAIALTAEVQAANEKLEFDWYLPGCKYDRQDMNVSAYCPTDPSSDGSKVGLTYLPRVGMRQSDESMRTASPAIVKLVEP